MKQGDVDQKVVQYLAREDVLDDMPRSMELRILEVAEMLLRKNGRLIVAEAVAGIASDHSDSPGLGPRRCIGAKGVS